MAGLARQPAFGMAAGTAVSRATGFARTVTLAAALGVSTVSDAYNTANTAPNMLFALVAGGTLGAALVPMLARGDDPDVRRETASVILGTVTAWAALVSVLMALGAPVLMRVLAAGSGGRADRQELLSLGASWMRIFAPQVALYTVSVIATGIMSAHRRLTLGAVAPVATNVITIAGCLAFVAVVGTRPEPAEVDGPLVAILGWSTTLAVAAMAAIQLAGARRVLPGLRFTPRRRHPAIKELRTIGSWTLLYVAVNQIGVAVVVAIASDVECGVSAYQWAFAIMQLPYAVVAVSIFSAAYPALARVAADDPEARSAHVGRAAAPTIAILVPASVLLILLADPVATLLVGSVDRPLVAGALRGFGLALLPFTIFQLLVRASYARSDTRTPALVNIAVNATMLAIDAAALALLGDPAHLLTGLAVGHAASYAVGCLALHTHLQRNGALTPLPWVQLMWRPALGALIMGVPVAVWASPAGTGRGAAAASLALVAVAAGGAYGLVGAALGLHRHV